MNITIGPRVMEAIEKKSEEATENIVDAIFICTCITIGALSASTAMKAGAATAFAVYVFRVWLRIRRKYRDNG